MIPLHYLFSALPEFLQEESLKRKEVASSLGLCEGYLVPSRGAKLDGVRWPVTGIQTPNPKIKTFTLSQTSDPKPCNH
jgi:hypothetical protein